MSLFDKVKKFGEGVKVSLSQPIIVNSITYKIQSQLAEGGFGYVFLVHDPHGKEFALKKIVIQTQEALDNIRREIAFMRVLSGKPNIIELKDFEIREKSKPRESFIVMPYCSEGSLVNLLNNRLDKRLNEKEILDIFFEVAVAVHSCHSSDPPIIHRDIKLENILIQGGKYYLCDFGSATREPQFVTGKTRGHLESELERFTTLIYRSPEMCDLYMERWIDEKSDIWALGCLLYKLMYLVSPFEEGGKLKIINGKVVYPSKPLYSDGIISLLKSMFTVDPNDRPDIEDILLTASGLLGKTRTRTLPRKPPRAPIIESSSTSTSSAAPTNFFDLLDETDIVSNKKPSPTPPKRSAVVPPSSSQSSGPSISALSPPPKQGPSRARRLSDKKPPSSNPTASSQEVPAVADFFGTVTPLRARVGESVFDGDDFSKATFSSENPSVELSKTNPFNEPPPSTASSSSINPTTSNFIPAQSSAAKTTSNFFGDVANTPASASNFFGSPPTSSAPPPSNDSNLFQFFAPVGSSAPPSANVFSADDDFSKAKF